MCPNFGVRSVKLSPDIDTAFCKIHLAADLKILIPASANDMRSNEPALRKNP